MENNQQEFPFLEILVTKISLNIETAHFTKSESLKNFYRFIHANRDTKINTSFNLEEKICAIVSEKMRETLDCKNPKTGSLTGPLSST